jgi:lysozyme
VGLVTYEGYTEEAIIPVPGDVPTLGFGTTGGVKLGDKTTPPKALRRALIDIQKFEGAVKSCVRMPLTQTEYDLLVDFSYQYGAATLCKSTMVREINAGNYEASCRGYLLYKRVAGRDCSLPGSTCRGVWVRSKARYDACMLAVGGGT